MPSLLADGQVFPELDSLHILSDYSLEHLVPLFGEALAPRFSILSGAKFPKLRHLQLKDLVSISSSTDFDVAGLHLCKTLETLALSSVVFPVDSMQELLVDCPNLTGLFLVVPV